jgi:tetratricopeptide (TPR) repeat protein
MKAERPADAHWWWYLDEQVSAERQRRLKRALVFSVVGVVLLGVLYVIYDRILAAPPNVREAISHVYEGERSLSEGDVTQAIEKFEAAAEVDPENVDAYLWLGVLYEAAGEVEKAESAFEKARALFANEVDFLLQRGLLYMTLNDLDAANRDALAAIELSPDKPEGYFLLGGVAEQAGDLELARNAFEKTSELAEATGNVTMQATARIRLATVLQQLMVVPEQ